MINIIRLNYTCIQSFQVKIRVTENLKSIAYTIILVYYTDKFSFHICRLNVLKIFKTNNNTQKPLRYIQVQR